METEVPRRGTIKSKLLHKYVIMILIYVSFTLFYLGEVAIIAVEQ